MRTSENRWIKERFVSLCFIKDSSLVRHKEQLVPKALYRFKVTHRKNLMTFFIEIDEKIS